MSGVNQITIVGNVGSAPELSYGQSSVPFCRFSVAVNEQWKTDGEKREKVTCFPVIAFNGLAETCANYIDRGRLVAIQGRVQMVRSGRRLTLEERFVKIRWCEN